MNGVILVAIHTDGMGTYQARCMEPECGWKGVWTRKEDTAVSHGKQHNRHEGEE